MSPIGISRDERSEKITRYIQDRWSAAYRRFCNPSAGSLLTSELTQCPRRLGYKCLMTEKDTPEENAHDFGDSHFAKKKWVSVLASGKELELLEADFELADCNYNLVGRLDAVIRTEDGPSGVLIKIVGSDAYDRVCRDNVPRRDVVEMMTNLWLAEMNHGYLIYEWEDVSGVFTIFHVEKHKGIVASVAEKCRKITSHKLTGTIPERPKPKPFTECNVCEFSRRCWGKNFNSDEQSQQQTTEECLDGQESTQDGGEREQQEESTNES